MTSFSIQSFGCRVNQAEAFLWADEFQKNGLRYKENPFKSDFVLLNTCTITSRADRDVRSFIRKISRLNPKAQLILTGCYVERAPEELRNLPLVSHIFSNKEKNSLAEKVLSHVNSREKISNRLYRSRALVKIQDGCDFRCAFCIIPSVRGKSISTEKGKILYLVKKYTEEGFREIVLTGIHLCLYGFDLKHKSSLLELLKEIEALEGLGKVRLSSLDPRLLSHSLLAHITSNKKICPHFHLSLQHGSDNIIHRMGRKIDVAHYRKIITYLRQALPAASIGADIIVGFPGETEDDFEKTYIFLDQSPLTYFHVFPYSPRLGTEASKWPQVKDKVKKERAGLLRRLSAEKNTRFRHIFLGKEFDAVVIKKENSAAQVLTSNYFKVFIPSCPVREKEEVKIKITDVNSKETRGKIINAG